MADETEMTGMKTQFLREGATPTTFERVAHVAGITPPQYQRNMVELEDLDPPDEIIQRINGAIDAGEFSLTLNFIPGSTEHAALESDFWSGAKKNYQIKLPSGWGWTIPAVVSGWAPQDIGAEDVVQVQVTLTVKAKPTTGAIGT